MKKLNGITIGLILFLLPNNVLANAGVPMIVLGFPFMLVVLIPVCLIEILVLSKIMKISGKVLTKNVVLANIASTLIGYPLSWLLLLGIEFITTGGSALASGFWATVGSVTLQAAWLIPYESDLYWMVPVAGIVGLIPAYFISVWMEFFVMQKTTSKNITFKKEDVRLANLASYAFLLLVLILMLVVSILKNRQNP